MILSDGEIWEALERGEIIIDPFPNDIALKAIQPSSIDLRLHGLLRKQSREQIRGVTVYPPDLNVNDFIQRYTVPEDINGGREFRLEPGNFVIAKTLERITLPLTIAGRVEGKSSLARLGIAVHITAPKIDPGFSNNITLEIFNLGPFTVALRAGMSICVLILERLGRQAKQGYSGQFQTPASND
ncbi:MAG: dCTP deaminase [Chloroflexi bacterium]|nr:dCTP deaminase [Chloroflexota bacterium]